MKQFPSVYFKLEQSITSLLVQEKLWLLGQIVQQLQSVGPSESDPAAETAYLLRSPENARRLLESIAQLEAGQGIKQAANLSGQT